MSVRLASAPASLTLIMIYDNDLAMIQTSTRLVAQFSLVGTDLSDLLHFTTEHNTHVRIRPCLALDFSLFSSQVSRYAVAIGRHFDVDVSRSCHPTIFDKGRWNNLQTYGSVPPTELDSNGYANTQPTTPTVQRNKFQGAPGSQVSGQGYPFRFVDWVWFCAIRPGAKMGAS